MTADDPRQAAAAKALFESNSIWIGKTVLLETAWVLRSIYGLADQTIADAILRLVALRNVSVEDESAVLEALQLVSHGVEFADAVHVASRPAGASFRSFDQKFIKPAKLADVRDISAVTGT